MGAAAWDNEILEEGACFGEGAVLLGRVSAEDRFGTYLPPRVRVPPTCIASVAWWIGVGSMTLEGRGDPKGGGEP